MLSIDHSKKVLADLGKVAVDGIHIAKHGVGIGALQDIFALMGDVKDLIAEAPKALPELQDMDAKEAAEMAQAAYEMVKAVIAAIAG